MDTYAMHLAMAALVGASVVAVSAFYMHHKTLNKLLDLDKSMDKDRQEFEDDSAEYYNYSAAEKHSNHSLATRRKMINGYYRRASISLSDVTSISGPIDVNGSLNVDGKFGGHAGATKRAGHLIRATSPKSPVPSAFERVEGSDGEDDMNDNSDSTYLYTNGNNLSRFHRCDFFSYIYETSIFEGGGPEETLFRNFPEHLTANGEQIPIDASSMIRSHSVSGDLHGVQPDPVAADILWKEPEKETFVRLKISPSETPSADETDVFRTIQVYLKMREIAPWEKEIITDPSTPKPNRNPFDYTPERKTDVSIWKMESFMCRDSKEKLFPVVDATTFFTDLHHILKVIAAGNIRTLCYHRLVLSEHKFNLHLMLNVDREFLAQKSAPHRDFYNVRKVDTHVHHSACMNQKHLFSSSNRS
ncbi:AMP deaminase [Heracleum sosnowskyi]|uniref:AMP deaminase n=1 Tax=Heracleum sosnowskyi TaxID=360622 RepID=A0AAD8HFA2_9APIA|nr:AMP deaminase [Heracleum sosnowskyi]